MFYSNQMSILNSTSSNIFCLLFSDDSKFGKKLLEKMGWEEGKGLGATNQGMIDPIMLRPSQNIILLFPGCRIHWARRRLARPSGKETHLNVASKNSGFFIRASSGAKTPTHV